MPTYDYICLACKHRLELFQSMSEAPKKKCPKCRKAKLQRQIGAGAAILFKGSGFYQTDYRSSSYTEGAKQDSPGADSKSKDSAGSADKPKPAADAKAGESKPAPAASPANTQKASKSLRKKPG